VSVLRSSPPSSKVRLTAAVGRRLHRYFEQSKPLLSLSPLTAAPGPAQAK